MARTTSVSRTIEIAMLPVIWSKKTRRMKKAWKIGVNSQATNPNRLSGFAGASGIAAGGSDADADALGATLAPGAGVGAGEAGDRDQQDEDRENGGPEPGRRPAGAPRHGGDLQANRVVAAGIARVASRDPLHSHPAAPEQPVAIDGLLRVARAGRLVAAAGRHPGEHDSVQPDEPDPDLLHVAAGPPSTPPRWRSRRSAPTRVSWSASTIAGLAMMRTSQPGWNEGAIALSASRSRRLTRLRTTAPPSLRPVESPNRVVSRSVRRNRAVKRGLDLLSPEPCTAAKSCGRESITRRGELEPRPSVRPSVASDHEPAERQ